jgi:CBS domain-containing protein
VRTLLATHRHERFPVVLEGRLRGVMERRAADLALRSAQSVPVETAATCLAETPLREVQSRLIDSPGQLAVVVDKIGEDARVVGVITLHDLLRAEMLFAKEQED